MRHLGNLLNSALGREEVVRAAQAQAVLRRWDLIVGEALAERSWPDRYDHGTVWVAVAGSAWAQELRMIKDTILKRLRQQVRDPSLFTDVRFGVRPYAGNMEEDDTPDPTLPKPRRLTNETIGEIAERRLKNWPKPSADKD